MFNIGFPELMVILLVAFLVVGPKDLPKVARALARGIKKARALVDQLKEEAHWDEMMQEITQVKDTVDETVKEADVVQEFRQVKDQINQVKKAVDIKGAVQDVKKDLKKSLLETGVKEDLQGAKAELTQAVNEADKLARDVAKDGRAAVEEAKDAAAAQ